MGGGEGWGEQVTVGSSYPTETAAHRRRRTEDAHVTQTQVCSREQPTAGSGDGGGVADDVDTHVADGETATKTPA